MNTCPNCGNAIAADHPHGLCPACLLKKGLEAETLQCTKCNSFLDDDARFCSQCGSAVPVQSTSEGDPLRTALEAKLLGHYRIIRLLGRGGMGAVYLARDLTLDREVAVKVVKTTNESREIYDRLRREARTAAKLSHPNIVPLHAFGEVEGMPYFVMGYVRGESLADRLRREGKLNENDGRRILSEVADALDHAHRQGIIHRDIKPDNVLLDDESGRALLTDFGVAKAAGGAETMTKIGSVIGTPQYMSPEQASGRADLDARSDIYSLGVMAYAMFAGRLPFEGTATEILTKHMTQEPPPLRSLAPSVSDSTAQIVERCLAKDPTRRWSDARSLAAALGANEESQLPDALQGVEGRGLPGLVIAIALSVLFFLWAPPTPILILQEALIVFVYLFVVMRLAREGFSFAQSQRAIWKEPSWWLWWYPRSLRRTGNVWDCLPPSVRQLRWIVPVLFFFPLVFFPLTVITGYSPSLYRHPQFFAITIAAVAVIVVVWILFIARARGELQRAGLGGSDLQRVMFSIPLSRVSFWMRPHIAAVLAPIETSRRSDAPSDQLQSILRNADNLAGPLRPLGREAAIAARQLLASIDEIDRELVQLAVSIDPGEEQRLSQKIAMLDEGDELRALLEKQLELIRGLASRIEDTKGRRNRRIETLKALALHVASLRAHTTDTSADVGMLTDRVRALCDEIAQQAGNREDVIATVARES